MGISCVKFKAAPTSEPTSIRGRCGEAGRERGAPWGPDQSGSRLCLLPRDAASSPSSLKGIQKEETEKGDGVKEAVLEGNLSQCLLLALNP